MTSGFSRNWKPLTLWSPCCGRAELARKSFTNFDKCTELEASELWDVEMVRVSNVVGLFVCFSVLPVFCLFVRLFCFCFFVGVIFFFCVALVLTIVLQLWFLYVTGQKGGVLFRAAGPPPAHRVALPRRRLQEPFRVLAVSSLKYSTLSGDRVDCILIDFNTVSVNLVGRFSRFSGSERTHVCDRFKAIGVNSPEKKRGRLRLTNGTRVVPKRK